MSVVAPPDVLRWSLRSGDVPDCVVAALEMACGVSYEEALAACLGADPDVLTHGMYWRETKKAAKRLGFKMSVLARGRYDIDESTGILHVYQPRKMHSTSHVVYLWDGRIIEPKSDRRQMWRHPEQFIAHYGYRSGSLLVIEEKP